MNKAIRALAHRTIESPTGGLVVTAAVWAALWPWLADRRRHAAGA
jgi:hypothetical protein